MTFLPTIILLLAIIFSFVSATLLVPSIDDALRSWIQNIRIRNGIQSGNGDFSLRTAFETILSGGIPLLDRLTTSILKNRQARNLIAKYRIAFAAKGIKASNESLLQIIIVASVIFWILSMFVTASILIGSMFFIVLLFIFRMRIDFIHRDVRRQLIEQLPDAIKGLAVCYGAGLTLYQAIESTSKDISAPIKSELEILASDIAAGRSISESLSAFKYRSHVSAIDHLSAVLEIHQRTGGSLEKLLFSAADAVRSSLDLERSLKVQTAQSRLSYKVVTVMPLLILIVMGISNPHYVMTFFTTPVGILLFSMACIFELFGVFAIRKTLKIDFGQDM